MGRKPYPFVLAPTVAVASVRKRGPWIPALLLFTLPLSACVSGRDDDVRPDYEGSRPPVRSEAGPPPPPVKIPLPEMVNTLSTRVEKSEDIQRNVTSNIEKRLGLMEKEITGLRGEVDELRHAKTRLEAELAERNKPQPPDTSHPDYDPAELGPPEPNEASVGMDGQPVSNAPLRPDGVQVRAGGQPVIYSSPHSQPTAPTSGIRPAALTPGAKVPAGQDKKGGSPTAGITVKPKPESPKQAYDEAFLLLKGGRYDESLAGFKNYMEWFPNDTLADNAQYWIGELYYVQRKFPEALMAFNQVLVRWPNSGKVPASLLKIGFSFFELEDMENAKNSLSRLVSDYPDSPTVAMAKQRLEVVKERMGKR
ncbi:MAG: Cell division coordinator CpoB [Magnetococcales bacterium]|nr:Cell division coordinator CpoB [Magnetococcales bacterium]HIJ82596.1 tol-pal system protein YbgF [Magnetococcales bacterium]